MRIWTITNDNENCTSTGIACTREEAAAAALAFVESYWEAWMGEEPMPTDWQQALSDLQTKVGFMDSIVVEEHDISHHPELQPDPFQISEEAKAYRNAVPNQSDDLEVDDNALVLLGDDDGAFVAAWVWVSDDMINKIADRAKNQ